MTKVSCRLIVDGQSFEGFIVKTSRKNLVVMHFCPRGISEAIKQRILRRKLKASLVMVNGPPSPIRMMTVDLKILQIYAETDRSYGAFLIEILDLCYWLRDHGLKLKKKYCQQRGTFDEFAATYKTVFGTTYKLPFY